MRILRSFGKDGENDHCLMLIGWRAWTVETWMRSTTLHFKLQKFFKIYTNKDMQLEVVCFDICSLVLLVRPSFDVRAL